MIKLIVANKINCIININFLIDTINNLQEYFDNYHDYIEKLTLILNRISHPITLFVTNEEIGIIDKVIDELIRNKKYVRSEIISNKVSKLWELLSELYRTKPSKVVDCVTHVAEKNIPKKLVGKDKEKFTKRVASKFITKSKKVNTTTDSIFHDVKNDLDNHQLDALSISGLLLSFVLNSESHLYYIMENLKVAKSFLENDFDIEEIFSLESKVEQNNEIVTDVKAIRNAVCHGAFNIIFDREKQEYVIDFESILSGYKFNKIYTGSEFLVFYSLYDRLRDTEELLIRVTYLKSILSLFCKADVDE